MAKRGRFGLLFGIAGLLFAAAGLVWTFSGNTPIGMMNVCIGMMFVAIAAAARRKEGDPPSGSPMPSPNEKGGNAEPGAAADGGGR